MTDDPKPHKQTRDTFITLYNTRLFTSEQVWDMCHRGQRVEREKVLGIINYGKDALQELSVDGSWSQVLQAKMDVLCWIEEKLREGKGGE